MQEKLYTIPLMDAMKAEGECPLCFAERSLEENALRFILGESYMESDMREKTDQQGFCRMHFKKMYDYGNSLGSAWILSTHLKRLNRQFYTMLDSYVPEKNGAMSLFKKRNINEADGKSKIGNWVKEEENHCYFCNHISRTFGCYIDTFFFLLKRDKEFLSLIEDSKGFCLHHFGDLMEAFEHKLSMKEKEKYAPVFMKLMKENMARVEEDIGWFIEKYDYRNKDADWKNSKDAIPRTMQKIAGGYPGDLAYHNQK